MYLVEKVIIYTIKQARDITDKNYSVTINHIYRGPLRPPRNPFFYLTPQKKLIPIQTS